MLMVGFCYGFKSGSIALAVSARPLSVGSAIGTRVLVINLRWTFEWLASDNNQVYNQISKSANPEVNIDWLSRATADP